MLDEKQLINYCKGKEHAAYEIFSPNKLKGGKIPVWRLRVWAPNALCVSVVGDFNGWEKGKTPMTNYYGVWEAEISGVAQYDMYKFAITSTKGTILKTDPYAYHFETSPGTCSKFYDINGYEWKDKEWIEQRIKNCDTRAMPINIYEVHFGSWQTYDDGAPYNYIEFGTKIAKYCKSMGYTHVELLPITEYPYDASWGYQPCGMFAPTSRYGTPRDFMKMVDILHANNIGIILDWVPAHFPKDEHGLYEFDGTHLYEYSDPLKMEHTGWGTVIYDFSKPQVKNFLISSAMFFMEKYHIDGIRMDAVASMLYLNYGRENGEWRPNIGGGNYNLEAIDFIRELNSAILTAYPGTLMIAEESTSFPLVTAPPSATGLGFTYKWNMGWMNDVLEYMKLDPFYRSGSHNKMTFSITYAYSENFMLPISHDEVVHGKYSILSKMPGMYNNKFAELRTFFAFMMGHPGKKLLFMGSEFGQFIEWDYKKQLDWLLLDFENHKLMQNYVKDLNKLYLKRSELYENDCDQYGFDWIIADDISQNVYAWRRVDKSGNEIICVFNFSPVTRINYQIGVKRGNYRVIMNSDDVKYGGKGLIPRNIKSIPKAMHKELSSIILNLVGESAVYLSCGEKK